MGFRLKMDDSVYPPQIMGRSKKIIKLFRDVKKVASKDLPVLLIGENGTYKELIARLIHYESERARGPFVALSFNSVPKEILEVELFGYPPEVQKETKKGKIIEANGGTLFLDEIIDADVKLQEKIYRFICQKNFKQLNSDYTISSNVRLICSMSKDPKEFINKGLFYEDLYKLLKDKYLKIPPLRERKEDIFPIANYLLKEITQKYNIEEKELSKDARDFLEKYDWPGNIRELENTIKKAAILSANRIITKKDLLIDDISSYSIKDFLEEKLKRYLKEMTNLQKCNLYNTVLAEVEKSLISIILKETGFNQLKAARTLGINRNTLRAKIKEYKIRF